jgi:hypothetical protein
MQCTSFFITVSFVAPFYFGARTLARLRRRGGGVRIALFCLAFALNLVAQKEIMAQKSSSARRSLPQATAAKDTTLLDSLLRSKPEWFGAILQNPAKHRVQILYTQINRDAKNRPTFRSFAYRLDAGEYFYPASTVKLPVALAALEKMNRLNLPNKYLPLLIDSANADQTPALRDESAPNGMPSVAHYVKKIFLVSDNDAHNRLLEFVTPDELNASLHAKGYRDAKITRRLSIGSSPEQDRLSNPLRIMDSSVSRILYRQEAHRSTAQYDFPLRELKQGKGVKRGNVIVSEPMDFTESNYISLETLQRILRATIFPDAVPARERFRLTKQDYDLVYSAMAMFPRESPSPLYDTAQYWDSYVKFALFGDVKTPMPPHIRIFNKVGDAYGYTLENAYIVDFEQKIEFFLTAVVYANENEIFNDNKYEYDEVTFPFLANLGRVVYDFERARPKARAPDLRHFAKYQSFPAVKP